MAEGRRGDDWAHTSNLLCMFYNRHRGDKEEKLGPADFNPMIRRKAAKKKDIPVINIRDLRGAFFPAGQVKQGGLIGGGTRAIAGPQRSNGPLP